MNKKQVRRQWIKDHKKELIIASIGITTVAIIVGVKKEKILREMWKSLEIKMKRGIELSPEWFENSSIGELKARRECYERNHMNPKLNLERREECRRILPVSDRYIGEKEWAMSSGFSLNLPPRENGSYLLNDD